MIKTKVFDVADQKRLTDLINDMYEHYNVIDIKYSAYHTPSDNRYTALVIYEEMR